MSIYELQIKPYKDLIFNNINSKALETTNAIIKNLSTGTINVNSIDVDSINYNTITNNGIKIKVNPVYFIQRFDNEKQFTDTSKNWIIDFSKIGDLTDININLKSENDQHYYQYIGELKTILIEVNLIYSYITKEKISPRCTIDFLVNDKVYNNIYFGVHDSYIFNNIFNNKYIIDIDNETNKIAFKIAILYDNNLTYTIKAGSYICFKEL